jgi:lipopolysaccharide transport system ATP-binding protein
MDFYNALIAEKENATVQVKRLEDGRAQTSSGTGEAAVADIALIDASGRPVECIDVGSPVTLRVVVRVYRDIDRLVFGYGIKDRLGQVIYGTNTHLKDQALLGVAAGTTIVYEVAFPANLGPGSYSVQTALCSADTHLVDNYEWRDLALVFNVVNISKAHFAGCAWIDPEIRISMS